MSDKFFLEEIKDPSEKNCTENNRYCINAIGQENRQKFKYPGQEQTTLWKTFIWFAIIYIIRKLITQLKKKEWAFLIDVWNLKWWVRYRHCFLFFDKNDRSKTIVQLALSTTVKVCDKVIHGWHISVWTIYFEIVWVQRLRLCLRSNNQKKGHLRFLTSELTNFWAN